MSEIKTWDMRAGKRWPEASEIIEAMQADFLPVQPGEITPKYQAVFGAGSTVPKWVEVTR